MEWIFLLAAIYLTFAVISALLMSSAAKMKGYGEEVHAFAACLCLGVFGCLYVIALPDKTLRGCNERIIELLKNSGDGKATCGAKASNLEVLADIESELPEM